MKIKNKINILKRDIVLLIKSPQEFIYSFTYPKDQSITIHPYNNEVYETGEKIIHEINKKIPELKIDFIGSPVLKIAGQKDIDLLAGCNPKQFKKFLPHIMNVLGKPSKRRKDFIEWHTSKNQCSVEFLLVNPKNIIYKKPLKTFRLLQKNKDLQKDYEQLKKESNGISVREYKRRRLAFFNKIEKRKEFDEAAIETEEIQMGKKFPNITRQKLLELLKKKNIYAGAIALIGGSFAGNILNFLYNSYLERVLGFEHFALIGLMNGLLSFASIFFGAYTTTANYRSAFLIGKYGNEAAYTFWQYTRKKALKYSVIIVIIWIILTPLIMKFFDAQTPWLLIMFSMILLVGFANGVDRGFISAKLLFGSLAVINLADPIIRFLTTIVLIFLGKKFWSFSVIPIAIVGTFIFGWILVKRHKEKYLANTDIKDITYFPTKFFGASLLTGFSSIAFSTFDILLANHFLDSTQAGEYTLLSLVGKMVYYMGGLTTPFIVPLISKLEGAKKNSKHTMYILLACTALLAGFGFITFGLLGSISIPILYGAKAVSVVSLLPLYTFGMLCYTISKALINYFLIKKMYTFTIATSLLAIVQIGLITMFHANIGQISSVMSVIWMMHLTIVIILHFLSKRISDAEQKIIRK